MSRVLTYLCCAVTMLAFVGSVSADLIVYDGFDYAEGTLSGNAGGEGWDAGVAWDGGQTVSAPGLEYEGLESVGNKAGTASTVSYRLMPAGFDAANRTLWISFLCVDSGTPSWSGISPFTGSSEALFIGKPSGSGTWGVALYNAQGDSGATTGAQVSDVEVSEQSFFVVRIINEASNARISAWINPALGQEPSVEEAFYDNVTAGHTNGRVLFDRVRIGGDGEVFYDELRVGDTYMDVSGALGSAYASNPSPATEATDVPRDVVLTWEAGEFAATHDVYLGTSYDDVNDGSGTLVSDGQAGTSYDAGRLEFGQTYYWRVDEVNAAPDNTVFPGEIWSFTVEPFAYVVENILASSNVASSDTAGPENTINGSGLDENDLHSFDAGDMWLVSMGGETPYIQYEFDGIYKLHEMLVWNHNTQFEGPLGFGSKDVTIEYSTDGVEWTVLGDFEFAQGTGVDGYAANTMVDFQGLAVRFVRLTTNSAHGGAGSCGLSEVRFLYIPAYARELDPADGTSDVAIDTDLAWRAGREAVTHDVYFGTDRSALALVDSTEATTFDPGALDFATIYHWKVDEVNEAEATSVWEGDLQSFATREFATIEDFESYNDEDNVIYESWIDGWYNGTGSFVGYLEAPFAERSIVKSGVQSMPLTYDNSVAPYYSETSYEFDSLDLTAHGADSLAVNFRGRAATFSERGDGSILMGAGGADIWGSSDEFRFAYKELSGNGSIVARVDSLFNSNGWAKAGVMIRQNLNGTAINAAMFVTPANGGTFQYRTTAGAASSNTAVAGLAAPYWVKLTRTDDIFTAQYSADGVTWSDVDAEVEIAMSGNVCIGLALTSHDASIMTNAEFSNVSTTGSVTGDWEIVPVGVEQPGNEAETLYVAVEDASGNVVTVTNSDAEASVATSWTQWRIPFSALAGVDMSRVKALVIGLGDRDNPIAGGSGLVYIDDIQYGCSGLFTAEADGGVVMVADGTDIWGTSDEFRFAYQELTGDGSITARVDSLANTNGWAKAGVMIRQDLSGPAANAALVVTPSNGISFQYRLTAGASCGSLAQAGLTAPYWVKLTRTGDVFTAEYSADGLAWEEIVIEEGVNIALSDPVYIGLALTSHSDGVKTMGAFSDIETTGQVSGDWQALGIGLD